MTLATLNYNGKSPPLAPELAQTLRTLQRRFGDSVIGRLVSEPAEVIPTGFPALDEALGIGGLPRGRIVDIFGPESSGKTTLCLHVIAQAQRQGGVALFIDTEHGLDLTWAQRCGVDTEALYVSQPESAEMALEIVAAMAQAGVSVIVIDSAAALTPRAEVETDMGDHHLGLMAKLMSQALRKLAGPLRRQQTLLLFTNQMRCRATSRRQPDGPTGGRALRHYASVQLELRPQRVIRQGGSVVGRRIRATVTKSKVAAPQRSALIEIRHEPAR
jgi:recombination protein RecA